MTPSSDGFRKGAQECRLKPGTKAHEIYGDKTVERHRHKYELNKEYAKTLEKNGLVISGESPTGKYPEVFELPSKRFYIGVIFRPEFKSRLFKSHPLTDAFIAACNAFAIEKAKG